jgi:hypothetical protein
VEALQAPEVLVWIQGFPYPRRNLAFPVLTETEPVDVC